MRYVDEYRSEADAQRLLTAIRKRVTREWSLMEICGGQTHTFVKFGIDRLLPRRLTLVHGPGCPVCVTPLETIDRALAIAHMPGVVFTSFGDMLRVPGSRSDLLSAKAAGADVRVVYSPLDAVKLAVKHPDRQVVFLAVGFETTAPANAAAVWDAKRRGLANFTLLVSHVLVPPAMETILAAEHNQVQAFLAAGHVCSVMGYRAYEPLAARHEVPIVVTGFEPTDLLHGTLTAVTMLEEGRWGVANCYGRAVHRDGNAPAQDLISRVFMVTDRKWRGIGTLRASGLALRPEFATFDAERRFGVAELVSDESPDCVAGDILQGRIKPFECEAFGTRCTPERPLGAPMVSSEGACAAYYHYGRTAAYLPQPEVSGV